MWKPMQMEPATGRAVIAAGIVGAHDATRTTVAHFAKQLEDASSSCEYHVHPDKLEPIAEALKKWREHTLAWISENDEHRQVLYDALNAAEPTRWRRGSTERSAADRARNQRRRLKAFPAFIEGERRGPPEDVGSVTGFMEFLEAMLGDDGEPQEESGEVPARRLLELGDRVLEVARDE